MHSYRGDQEDNGTGSKIIQHLLTSFWESDCRYFRGLTLTFEYSITERSLLFNPDYLLKCAHMRACVRVRHLEHC